MRDRNVSIEIRKGDKVYETERTLQELSHYMRHKLISNSLL